MKASPASLSCLPITVGATRFAWSRSGPVFPRREGAFKKSPFSAAPPVLVLGAVGPAGYVQHALLAGRGRHYRLKQLPQPALRIGDERGIGGTGQGGDPQGFLQIGYLRTRQSASEPAVGKSEQLLPRLLQLPHVDAQLVGTVYGRREHNGVAAVPSTN
eukprot:CAMPEP_0171288902 /NCGR_PEP_ID=MMETSP0790-20130122/70332_1 /TAXON_ID=2925 /ORGANISM="Alexandrium catenella, Strain OF101" /LENGTH=158 /DNA_ID=CAMNT_0011758521 /DNA_START=171 /DNA_END=646 /DNA_ORIENTATION=-